MSIIWEGSVKLFDDDDYFNYFMKQTEEVKNSVLSLLPISINDLNKIDKNYKSTVINVLIGAVNTLKSINDNETAELGFRLKEFPSILNYIGCFTTSRKSSEVTLDSIYLLSRSDLEKNYDDIVNKKLYALSLNPNLTRACKLIYGDTIRNPDEYLQVGWFRAHVSDNHTQLYFKNIGKEYSDKSFTENDKNSAKNWLWIGLHNNISTALNCNIPSIDFNYFGDCEENNIQMFLDTIKTIQDRKDIIYGYEFVKDIEQESKSKQSKINASKLVGMMDRSSYEGMLHSKVKEFNGEKCYSYDWSIGDISIIKVK